MNRIERHWYQPVCWLTALLAPLTGLFALVSGLRRWLYRCRLLRSERVGCPLVVIGNINVGGVGKTPLTLSLLKDLAERSVHTGVVSRGYGGNAAQPMLVRMDSPAELVGDEPLLLAHSGAPVAIGRDRVAAARLLLAAHPELDLILSDDGLQHYRLARDAEIVVLDGARGLGNGWLLPGGPLREAASRLRTVNALVINGEPCTALRHQLPGVVPQFAMRLQPGRVYKANAPDETADAADFAGQRVIALAGIGHPQRFFDTLRAQGFVPQATLVFPDHHQFSATDLPDEADALIVTSKDAVKLRGFDHARLWVLPVMAQVEPDLTDWLLTQLGIDNGRKTA